MKEEKKKTDERKIKKKDYRVDIEIPAGIEANVENNIVIMKKDGKELREKVHSYIKVKKESNKIILEVKNAKKKQKKEFGTIKSHIKNMIEGLTTGFEYELEICTVHFPMTITFDKVKKQFLIKNLLGEKAPRIINSVGNVEVEIMPPKIIVKSYDLRAAGQTAANLEKITRIKNRDRNKFQDGIFITKKPGKVFV